MKSIGIFDSGFGGLSVMREIVKLLPNYNYVYLGDTKNAPFGSKNHAEIKKLTENAVDYLFNNDCELVILACNSASSQALRQVQKDELVKANPDKRVLGVIVPAAQEAVAKSKSGRIGVLATVATVSSGAYEREIKKLNPNAVVCQQACPELVDLIEDGQIDSGEFKNKVLGYCELIKKYNVDTVILGCTHYPLAIDKFRRYLGDDILVINQGALIATRLADYLMRHPEIESKLGKDSSRQFYSTKAGDHFNKNASNFYGENVGAQQVNLL